MEWNIPHWDWDNLVMFNVKAAELPKKLQTIEWGKDGEGDIEFGSLYSYGGGLGSGTDCGRGSDGSGSDMVHISSSKSSKSTSVDSSPVGKTSKFTFEGSVGNFSNNKESTQAKHTTASSLSHEASVGSGEPVIGLKLGQRTYFKDFYAGSNPKASAFSAIPVLSEPTAKRSKSSGQRVQTLCCQVEGCNLNLSSAKEYHRKHRICESHSKCPKVIICGLERRFCQQCSRFHELAEFDEKKRSCRKRLSDHNARRRKPRADSSHLNVGRLSSPPYDGRQDMGVILNKFPFLYARSPVNAAWDCPLNSKFTLTTENRQIPAKTGAVNEHLRFPSNVLSNSISILPHSDQLLQSKHVTKVSNDGAEECNLSSNMVAAQDLHRALSLLSTNSRSSCEPEPILIDQAMHMNNITIPLSTMRAVTHAMPLASRDIWQTEQNSTDPQSRIFASQSNGSIQFQEFQLFKGSYRSGFDSNQLN